MRDLVESTIDAHGGPDNWQNVSLVSAALSVHGAGLKARGPVGDGIAERPMRVTVNTQKQEVSFDGSSAPDAGASTSLIARSSSMPMAPRSKHSTVLVIP
jgi:hypothetical protein